VQIWLAIVDSQVAADPVSLMDRHKEPVSCLILDLHVLPLKPGQALADHAVVAADAILYVDDIVAFFEIGEQRFWRRLAGAERAPPLAHPAKDLCIGQHGQSSGRQRTTLRQDAINQGE